MGSNNYYTILPADDVEALRGLPWKADDILEHTSGLRGMVEQLDEAVTELAERVSAIPPCLPQGVAATKQTEFWSVDNINQFTV